jgi:3'(2'), 5'-bisphosphate nucleotidase
LTRITGDLIEILCELAREGGDIAMRHHGRLENVMAKADNSPLTVADLEVDQYLCEGLEKAFPDIPVVTEERAESHAPGFVGECFFLVDPIDGTKEFVKNRGEFTVNIALVESGTPVAGVVCAPAVGRLFAGKVGEGAFEMPSTGGPRKPLAPRKPDNDALIVVASRSHLTLETQAFVDANPVASFTSAGSSLKFCLLAAGEADLYPRYGPTMEWDTAAGHAVLAATGGMVEEISGAPLKYGKPNYLNPFFIAYTPGTKFKRVPA